MPGETTLGVRIFGDATSLKASLAESMAATERFAAVYKGEFAEMSDATLRLATSENRLAAATARYGAGSVGAAQATLRYRREVEALRDRQIATASAIGRSLTTFVTAPTLLVGYAATKMGIEFNKQMLLVQTQAGASASEVKSLSGQVLELARVTPQGPVELARGLYHLESLGLRGSAAMRTLHISALAAGMGIANLEDVTTALGGAVVTGIHGAENYQTAMATLTATVGAGNMRFEDLAGSIGSVAPAAAAAGISLPELGAAMATLTDRGFSADEAATRLRMTFALIQSPSEKAKKALKDMGVNADSLGAILRQPGGLLKVLEILHSAIDRVGKTRGNRDLLASFGGGRSGLGIQTLVQSLDSSLSSYKAKLEQVSAGEKKYAENQKAYLESPAYKLATAWSTVESDLVKLGASFAPVAVKAADAVATIADAFEKLPGPVKSELAGVIAIFAIGGPLLIGMAAAARAARTLRGAFGLVGASAATAAAETEGSMVGVEASTAGAATKVSALRLSLLALAAPIVVPIAIEVFRNDLTNIKGDLGQTAHHFSLGNLAHLATDELKLGAKFIPGAAPFSRHHRTSDLGPRAGLPPGLQANPFQPVFPGLGEKHAARQSTSAPPFIVGASKEQLPETPSRAAQLATAIAEARLAAAQGSPGGQARLASALRAQIAADERGIATQQSLLRRGVGKADEHSKRIQALMSDESGLYDELNSQAKKSSDAAKKAKKSAEQFALPLSLQIAEARADALAAMNPNADGPTALQLRLAKQAKNAAMDAIHSHGKLWKGLIDAWNIVNQADQTLARTDTHRAAENYKKLSSTAFASSIAGLTREQRIAVELKYAQAEAHGGFVPTGPAAQGISIGQIVLPNVTNHRQFLQELQRLAKSQPLQTRGRHGGVRLGIG